MTMATKTKEETTVFTSEPAKPNSEVIPEQPQSVDDFFKRAINDKTPVVHLTLKRILTKPLVSMGRTKVLVAECTSEMYTMDLPLKGRSGGVAPARVIDIIHPTTKEEGTLIVHEVMASSLERAAFRILKTVRDDKDKVTYVEKTGTPLKGHTFAFKAGDIDAEKRHRNVEVAELERS